MNKASKTIYLARHAKSSWNSPAQNDFERPLSRRGMADAQRVASELAHRQWIPEKMISSPAERAKQTCHAFCEGIHYPQEDVIWEPALYGAYTITLLQLISHLPEALNSVMLIGHNPAMEDCLEHLCDAAVFEKLRQVNGKLFTTSNVARLHLSVPWKDIVMQQADLESLIRPKALL